MSTRTRPAAWRTAARAVLLSALCGARATVPITKLASHGGRADGVRDEAPWRWLGHGAMRALLRLSMVGELTLDKMPGTPSRLAPIGLAGRCATGSAVGAVVFAAGRRRWWIGALIGAAAAYTGAVISHRLRVGASDDEGVHPIRGLVEDAVVVSASSRVARATVEAAR